MEYKYINPEYLDSVTGRDPDITKEIVSIFKEQVISAYKEMLALLDAKKYYELGLLAHKVKSSVAIMGMDSLAGMLKTLELHAKEGKETGSYLSYIERFHNETVDAINELDDLVRTL